ncbi:hypothetical protein NM688_g708 [Phlebia brevispora]|uniref:Uncharacterized protein n=1 Tax=Phlebia brevispora TaxID=194682 RepID=A0ACC1TDV4_9APHY|nr:hypothetical protein NM688_g708 [Phlebia brevispora]
MRASFLLFLGAAVTALGSPVPSQVDTDAPQVTTATYIGTKIFDSIVPYSPWLITATTVETWVETRTLPFAAPNPTTAA